MAAALQGTARSEEADQQELRALRFCFSSIEEARRVTRAQRRLLLFLRVQYMYREGKSTVAGTGIKAVAPCSTSDTVCGQQAPASCRTRRRRSTCTRRTMQTLAVPTDSGGARSTHHGAGVLLVAVRRVGESSGRQCRPQGSNDVPHQKSAPGAVARFFFGIRRSCFSIVGIVKQLMASAAHGADVWTRRLLR